MTDISNKRNTEITKTKKGLDFNAMRRRKGIVSHSPSTNSPLQVVFMMDITGSMYSHFDLVREKLSEMVSLIKPEHPDAQFAVFAYRNYGDEKSYDEIFYTSPLTSDIDEIFRYIQKIDKGGGGNDGLTCMEECLKAGNTLNWLPLSPKVLVVIGDMPPHGLLDKKFPNDINYNHEIDALKNKGVNIFSVFCGYHPKVKDFYIEMAETTGGEFLELSEIDILVELLTAICVKVSGRTEYFRLRLESNNQMTLKQKKALLMLDK